jgi:hypothetical protein
MKTKSSFIFYAIFLLYALGIKILDAQEINPDVYFVKPYDRKRRDIIKHLNQDQRRARVWAIFPDAMRFCSPRFLVAPDGDEGDALNPAKMEIICRKISEQDPYFVRQLRYWKRHNIPMCPELARLVHDLNSKRQAGDK